MRCRTVAVGFGAVLALSAMTGAQQVSTIADVPAAAASTVGPGTQLWLQHYPGGGALAMAIAPDGGQVFITGYAASYPARDYVTIAFAASTGDQLWVRRYDGPAGGDDYATAIAVSPDGSRVFVTGRSPGRGSGRDYATVAYSARTGVQLWVSRYNGPGNRRDDAHAIAISPNGSTVFVTGVSFGRTDDYATVAYSSATGARRWVARFNGSGDRLDSASSVSVGPGGARVFVTGFTTRPGSAQFYGSRDDYATIAYRAGTGAQLWLRRYNKPGTSTNSQDIPVSIVANAPGGRVFVTGLTYTEPKPRSGVLETATVAYSAATGTEQWVRRYGAGGSAPSAMAVNSRGTSVFVTGNAAGGGYTIAYNAATGASRWVALKRGAVGRRIAISPNGSKVFVAAEAWQRNSEFSDTLTTVYDAATGTQRWAARYTGYGDAVSSHQPPSAICVNPTGTTVFVAGGEADYYDNYTNYRAFTIAYRS